MYETTTRQRDLPLEKELPFLMHASATPADLQPIYEQYFPRIYKYCLRRVGSIQEAEDLTSVIFSRALNALPGYRGGSMAAWLFRIAHNVVVNYFKSRRATIPLDQVEADAAPADELIAHLVRAEERQRLRQLVAQLPDEQQEMLALKLTGGLSAKEIGQVIGKSEGAVRVAIFRIVQQLREAWAQEEAQ